MEVARSQSDRGEVVLRRRESDSALELRVNGVFVMDTAETSSERSLAAATLAMLEPDRRDLTVLIGGLGLGFTLAAVLADARVGRVIVAEIEPDLVAWHRSGLVAETVGAVRDPRTELEVDDVRRVVASQVHASLDVLLLDVDNGPDYLVYDDNASVYRAEFLETCRHRTRPGGVVAVWSSSAAPELVAALRSAFGACEELALPVALGTRDTTYHVLVGRA
jgi:spermidine synthase